MLYFVQLIFCLFRFFKPIDLDNNTAGSAVVEEALDATDAGQEWERSADDSSGYFTLKNPNSGKFLSAANADTLTIQGIKKGKVSVCLDFFNF